MAGDSRPTKEHSSARLLLVAAIILCFLAVWIVVPPLSYPALVLAVGASEVGVWLILAGVVVAVLAGRGLASRRTAGPTSLLAAATVALGAVPLVQFPAAARHLDAAMHEGLGPGYLDGVPDEVRVRMRQRPLDPLELFVGLRAGSSRPVQDVPFAVSDGIQLTMDIYRPESRGSYPALVQVYGGAWQEGDPGDDAPFARYLASRGYVVFAIDYRHAPRWRWPSQLTDVRAALAWIAEHGREYDADPDRLILLGRSSGAQLAMVAAYEPGAPPVRAVVSYYGPVDLEKGYRHPPRPDPLDVQRIEKVFLGGTPDEVLSRYREASPITYVVRRLPPTLLVYGTRDHVVEARFGRLLHRRLRETGTTSVLLEIPWAEHAFDVVTGGPASQLALYHTERFLAWALASPHAIR